MPKNKPPQKKTPGPSDAASSAAKPDAAAQPDAPPLLSVRGEERPKVCPFPGCGKPPREGGYHCGDPAHVIWPG